MEKKIYNNDVFMIEDFFSKKDCDELICWSEQQKFEEAKVNIQGNQTMLKGVRNNDRLMFIDFGKSEKLWELIQPYCEPIVGKSKAIGLNEMFRIYKYSEGQKFKKHYDGSYERNEFEFSIYTFMIYLNDNFEGGNTWFKEFEIKPKTGTALVFNHDLLHEGMEITKGIKYVLRTDIMYQLI